MSNTAVPFLKVPELSSIQIEGDAYCFAVLLKRFSGKTKYETPFWKCTFRDRFAEREFAIWSDDLLLHQVPSWVEGEPYRLRTRCKSSQRGVEIKLVEVRPVLPEDSADGYDVANLYEVSRFNPDESFEAVKAIARDNIECPKVRLLVERILDDHAAALKQMPAASKMHHAFPGGLIEHIRSIGRLCAFLARHYAKYYDTLDPPLNKDVIVAAGILHDIGKLFELEYHPVMAPYTVRGNLIGHVVMGRDLVVRTAQAIEGFPEATLLGLEHAILAHHGKREFGAPILPQTLEALVVSFADEFDAKFNQAARALERSNPKEPFTDDVFGGPERRRMFRGRVASSNGDHGASSNGQGPPV